MPENIVIIAAGDRWGRDLRVAALFFLVPALLGLAGTEWIVRADEPLPIRAPVVLERGWSTRQSFEAECERYSVSISMDRTLDLERHQELIGIGFYFSDADARAIERAKMELDLAWRITSDGRLVAEGDSRVLGGGEWGSRIGKALTYFGTRRGQRYQVDVVVTGSSPTLQETAPELLVMKDKVRCGDSLIAATLLVYPSLGALVLGLCFALAAYVRHRVVRTRDPGPAQAQT